MNGYEIIFSHKYILTRRRGDHTAIWLFTLFDYKKIIIACTPTCNANSLLISNGKYHCNNSILFFVSVGICMLSVLLLFLFIYNDEERKKIKSIRSVAIVYVSSFGRFLEKRDPVVTSKDEIREAPYKPLSVLIHTLMPWI